MVDAPLNQMPLYVRGGAIVPYGPLVQHTDEAPDTLATVEIYAPMDTGSYSVAGPTPRTISYQRTDSGLHVQIEPSGDAVELVLYGVAATAAVVDGNSVTLQAVAGGVRVLMHGAAVVEVG
ncbi:MAG: hypothetical protein HC914_17650 [Chloroflexaceae bacterium]|nr:hypothetical protein [Chloroflexaceae bacterium]